jgi:hypothetical protein
VYPSTVVVSPEPFSPTPSISSENTEENPDDREPADEGDIQMEYSSDQFYSPSIGAVTKDYM